MVQNRLDLFAADTSELITTAERWRIQDPDAETAAELTALIHLAELGDEHALDGLRDRFSARLRFGTAGLRGALGAGSNRMNRVVARQTAAGLAAYVIRESGERCSAVVGYDGRKNSRIFAHDIAETLAGAGVRATVLPCPTPTPVLAFAVRERQCDVGVMVTASHNPAADNGIKVYSGWREGGAQIVWPADREIEALVHNASSRLVAPPVGPVLIGDEGIVDRYIDRTLEASTSEAAALRVVYTALHGVGADIALRVMRAGGYSPISVPEQHSPNPSFPTAPFPNPEEPGVLDLAVSYAARLNADVVIANDPDADRLAVAVPTEAGWRVLTGNEVGILLGWAIAERNARDRPMRRGVLATSFVSSPALGAIAEHFGLGFAETCTGFKNISRVDGLLYGYEEALGYLVDPDKVSDKDGVSAALVFLDHLSVLKKEGTTVEGQLSRIATAVGEFRSAQAFVLSSHVSEVNELMRTLRAHPLRTIDGIPVVQIVDYLDAGVAVPGVDLLRLVLHDGTRIQFRPSGTEPKLKVYVDVTRVRDEDTDAPGAEASTARTCLGAVLRLLDQMRDAL